MMLAHGRKFFMQEIVRKHRRERSEREASEVFRFVVGARGGGREGRPRPEGGGREGIKWSKKSWVEFQRKKKFDVPVRFLPSHVLMRAQYQSVRVARTHCMGTIDFAKLTRNLREIFDKLS